MWSARSARVRRQSQPLPWVASLLIILVTIVGGGWLGLAFLSDWAHEQILSQQVTGKDAIGIQLDALKTALTVAAGLGAGITLLLALRRQSTTERAQQFAEHDAQEQRITELYVAAAGQLGSDRAPVRLAGLYALQRLGQNNAELRQTVFDVVCAYLRMPFVPPREIREWGMTEPAATDDEPESDLVRHEELQVRLAAQRFLIDHTLLTDPPPLPRDEPESYWRMPDGARMSIDLSRAALVDFNFHDCQCDQFHAAGARFHGTTIFTAAQIHGFAVLGDAEFLGESFWSSARLHSEAYLGRTVFHGAAHLDDIQVDGNIGLNDADFRGTTDLSGAHFCGNVYLSGATFRGPVNLSGTCFDAPVDLTGPQFGGGLDLAGALLHPESTTPPGWKPGPAGPHVASPIPESQTGQVPGTPAETPPA